MRFLVDAQLPRRLARVLANAGHDAKHTLDLPDRNRTTDAAINDLADREDRVVISKDTDFRDSHLLRGTPRLLLEVTTGNIDNSELIALFEAHMSAIASTFDDSDHLELTRADLIVHPRRTS